MSLANFYRFIVDKAIAEKTDPCPTAPKAGMPGANSFRRRTSSLCSGKDSYRSKQATDRAWRREWELETQLHQVKLQNSTYQEQIRILKLERDAAEAEVQQAKRLFTCLRKDFEVSAELLNSTKSAVKNLQRRIVEVEVDAEQKDKEMKYSLAERDTMAAELAKVTDEKNILDCEIQDLRIENRDSESWMDEITACVQEVATHHANLESNLQVSEDIIHELQKVIKTDAATSEMNKKALLRTNADLEGQVETLSTRLEAEQKKKSQKEKECLRVHKQKALEVGQLQARLREKASENASLKLQSSAHLRALEALEADKAAFAVFGSMNNSIFEESHKSSAEKNTISCATTIVDFEPTSAGQAEQPTSLTEDETTKFPMHKRPRDHTSSPAQVLVILLCLLAALFSRLT